jgi:uncharacterized protein (TIGR02646 family)
MVRLRRGAPPALLLEHRAKWTQRWLEVHTGVRRALWAPASVRRLLSDELRKLTFGKCAFCEGRLEVTSFLEIEHYVAKTLRPEQTFEWTNLFPICRLCNSAKGDADHAGMLIKPDVDDPEDMLWLHPDTGELQPRAGLEDAGRQRVERTLVLCDLQRGQLCTKRIETMKFAIRWLQRLSRRSGRLDRPLREEWDHLMDPRTEYKFVIRHVFETRGAHELAAKDRLSFRIEE